jgi:hypothetical protein
MDENPFGLGKPEKAPSRPQVDRAREMRDALVRDAENAEGEDRDLVRGDGGTLGLAPGEDLNKDD